MNSTLLNAIKCELSPTLIDKVSNYINENRNNTSQTITGVLPLVLAYLCEKTKKESSAKILLELINDAINSDLFKNQESFLRIFETKKHSLLSKGNTYILELFKGKEEALFEKIAEYSNITKVASSGVLAVFLPLIIHKMGNVVIEKDITLSNINLLFDDEEDTIYGAIPSGLIPATVLLRIPLQKSDESEIIEENERDNTSTQTSKANKVGIWFFLLLIIILVILFSYFFIKA